MLSVHSSATCSSLISRPCRYGIISAVRCSAGFHKRGSVTVAFMGHPCSVGPPPRAQASLPQRVPVFRSRLHVRPALPAGGRWLVEATLGGRDDPLEVP